MSVSEKFENMTANAPWLWVTDTQRAKAWVCCLAMLVLVLLIVESLQPWRLVSHLQLDADSNDWFLVTQDLVEARDADTELVVLLGGSSAREYPAAQAFLSSELSRDCGRPIRFVNAASPAQRIAKSWAAMEYLSASDVSLVVVSLNYDKLGESLQNVTDSLDDDNWPIPESGALNDLLQQHGYQTKASGGWFSDTAWLFRLLQSAHGWKPAGIDVDVPLERFVDHRNRYRPPAQSLEYKREITHRYIPWRVPAFFERAETGLQLWLSFAERFGRTGTHIAYLALPTSPSVPAADDIMDRAFADYLRRLKLAGYPVADWRFDHQLSDHHFYDVVHLLPEGRRIEHPRFYQFLLSQLEGCNKG